MQANARGRSILYVFSFFDVGLVYAHILFVFVFVFVRAELFDLFAMIGCFAFLVLFLFWHCACVRVLFELLRRYIYICNVVLGVAYNVLHKRAVLVCAMRVNVWCVCVCVCVVRDSQARTIQKTTLLALALRCVDIFLLCVRVCV